MAERIFAVILMAVFAWFLFIASRDILQLVESQRVGDLPLLLYCAVLCVGWIGFLACLCWLPLSHRLRLFHFAQR